MDNNIDLLLKEKENELREIQLRKITNLENTIREKDNVCQKLELRYQELEKDFEYNLELIQERDEDIEELKEKMFKMKEILELKENDNSILRKQNEELRNESEDRIRELKDNLVTMKDKIKDLKQENQYLKTGQTDEIERNKSEFQKQIKVLQNMIQNHENTIRLKDEQLRDKIKTTNEENKLEIENLLKIVEKMKGEKIKILEEVGVLKAENSKLREDLTKHSKLLLEKDHQNADKIMELKLINKELDAKNEDMFRELESLKSNTDLWNNTLQEKFEQIRMEKEQLMEELLKKKLKYKNQIRQYEEEIKTLTFDKERLLLNEKLQKERLSDAEIKLQEERFSHKEQIVRINKNEEENLKKLKNEIELKEFQIVSLNNGKQELHKKIDEMKEEIKKIEEKCNEFDRENQILIDQITHFRNSPRHNLPASPIKVKGQIPKVLEANHLKFSPDSNPEHKIEQTDEVVSENFSGDEGFVSIIPSNDFGFMGMNKNPSNALKNISSKKKLKNSSSQQIKMLLDQIKMIQNENEELKETIRDLSQEIKNTEHFVKVSKLEVNTLNEYNAKLTREMNTCKEDLFALREKNLTLQTEKSEIEIRSKKVFDENIHLKEEVSRFKENIAMHGRELELRDSEINALKNKVSHYKNENQKLKSERDKLIEISNNLRSKVNRYEDELELVESKIIDDTKEKYPQVNAELEEELARLKEKDIKNIQIIEKLKSLHPNMKFDFGENFNTDNIMVAEVPEKDNKVLELYKNRMEEIRKDLFIKSSQKPIVDQGLVHIPNSQKATTSQKEIENKLKLKKKKSPPKARNYNLRDDS